MRSALKLLRLLDAIGASDDPVRISDLARRLDSNRSEVHRYVVTLMTAGWLEKVPSGGYQLTVKAAHLGSAALQQAGFGKRVSSLLIKLAEETNVSVCLAVLDDDATRVIKRATPGTAVHVTVALGRRLSLADGATGRVLIAHASDDTLSGLRARGVALPTDEDIVRIRAQGFAVTPPGQDEGVAGIAFPVIVGSARPTVALCAIGTEGRFDPLSAKALMQSALRELVGLIPTLSNPAEFASIDMG